MGTVAYLLYNAFMLLFATPFNALFLVYVALLSLALWSLVAICGWSTLKRWAGGSDRVRRGAGSRCSAGSSSC